MVGITDIKYNTFIDDTIFTLKATQTHIEKVINEQTGLFEQVFKSRTIKMERCTKNSFVIEGTQDYFLQQPYQDYFCFSQDELNIELQGEYNSLIYKSIEIEISECQGVNCADPAVIQTKLNNCYMQVFFTDKNILSKNLHNPVQFIGKQNFYISGSTFSKTINMYLIQNQIITDSGIFYEEIKNQIELAYSTDREQIVTKTSNRLFLLQISLEPSKQINYYRKYLSLSQALSQIGGIYNILFAIGCFICTPYAQLQYKRNLMNTVFGFQYSDNNEQGTETIQQKNIEINSTYQEQSPQNMKSKNSPHNQDSSQEKFTLNNKFKQRALSSISKANHQITYQITDMANPLDNDIINNIRVSTKKRSKSKQSKQVDLSQSIHFNEKMDKKQKKKSQMLLQSFFMHTFEELKLNTIDYLSYYISFLICKKRKRSRIIEYGLQKLYNHIDIYYIVNKLIEFEKLKRLILNDNQIKLFEYIPKPIIKIDKSSQKIIQFEKEHENMGILYEDNRTFLQKAEEAQKAYNSIMKFNKVRQPLDEKLIKLLHPKLIDMFKDNSFEKLEDNQEKYYKFKRKSMFTTFSNNNSPSITINNIQANNLTQSPQMLHSISESFQKNNFNSCYLEDQCESEGDHIEEYVDQKRKESTIKNYKMHFNTIQNRKKA